MSTDLSPLPENPTPQDFGFPQSPTAAQVRCWQNQERFLEAFSRLGSVGAACAEAGVPVPTQESWDLMDTNGFKRRKAHALQLALGRLESEIDRRGVEGIDKPIYWRGQRVDTIKEYSDNLLMFRAKKLDPAYRDNHQVTHDNRQVHITKVTYVSQASEAPEVTESRQVPEPEYLEPGHGTATDSGTDTGAE